MSDNCRDHNVKLSTDSYQPHCLFQIPFSKFYLAAKGRIQDKQEKMQLDKISYIGITLADAYNGPFNLEVDYIGVYFDSNHSQDFAYEMYQVPSYMIY